LGFRKLSLWTERSIAGPKLRLRHRAHFRNYAIEIAPLCHQRKHSHRYRFARRNCQRDGLTRSEFDGRGGGIRTPDPLLPKQMRYQTALRPDTPFSHTRAASPNLAALRAQEHQRQPGAPALCSSAPPSHSSKINGSIAIVIRPRPISSMNTQSFHVSRRSPARLRSSRK
jgi:hypothetical protein